MKRMMTVLAVLLFATPAWSQVTVTGTGTAKATPDMGVISMAVVSEAEVVATALENNGHAAKKLKSSLASLGVDDKDVCTTSFNIQQKYTNPKEGEPKLVGYVVQHSITVRVGKLADTGKVLDKVVKDGANRIYGVGFTFSDPEGLLDNARVAAVEDAKRKAEMMVKTAGAKLGHLKMISEQRSYNAYQTDGMAARASEPAGQPVSPGERTLTVQVMVVWDVDSLPGRKPNVSPVEK